MTTKLVIYNGNPGTENQISILPNGDFFKIVKIEGDKQIPVYTGSSFDKTVFERSLMEKDDKSKLNIHNLKL